MPRKCCVKDCRTNYDTKKGCQVAKKVPVYRFPSMKDEGEARQSWIDAIKEHCEFKLSDSTVVCENHWPKNYRKYRKKGHDRPADPPSIFGVLHDTPHRLSLEVRNAQPDQLDDFDMLEWLHLWLRYIET